MLIGLAGYARVGKDEVGKELLRQGWWRLAFADRVRQMAMEIDPIVWQDEYRLSYLVESMGWEQAKALPEVRRLLQKVGDGARFVLGEDVWITATMRLAPPSMNVVITDVRYPNEAKAIRQADGFVVRVTRPGVGPLNDHSSEVEVDSIEPDYVLDNDGPISDISKKVTEMVATLDGSDFR